MEKSWFIGISIGLVFVLSIFFFGYNSGIPTGQAFSFNSIKCSGGPDRQGTCPIGKICTTALNGICSTPARSCPTCLRNLPSFFDYKEYVIDTDTVDLSEYMWDPNERRNVKVLRIKVIGGDDQGLHAGGTDIDTIYISYRSTENEEGLYFYKHVPHTSQNVRFLNSDRGQTGRITNPFTFNHNSTRLHTDILRTSSASHPAYVLRIFELDTGNRPYLSIYFEADSPNSINYLGHSDSNTVTDDDVLYNGAVMSDISKNREDTLLPSNILVLNPDLNALSDRVKIRIPPK